jgi:hypothetical protein
MSSYFQETSSSLAPSVAASSAFNWQAIHNHHHQLQQQQMNLQPNPDIFHTHYTNLYHNQGYPHHQKYNNSNYGSPSSGGVNQDNISFPPSTSSSLPLLLNNHDAHLDHAQQYSGPTGNSTSNNLDSPLHRINGNNVPDNSTTTSSAATNNNVTNNTLEPTSKRNYSATSLELTPQSLSSLTYNKSITSTVPSISSPSISSPLTTSPLAEKLDASNIQAAQTAAAAAAAVAAYNTPNSAGSALDINASDSYTTRMNLGFPYGNVQSMSGAGVTPGSLGDPNAAAMAAVHAAAASHGCYDMYAAATMASKNSSFYPWMKNYPGKYKR